MASTQQASFQVTLDAAGVKAGAVNAAQELQNLQSQLARDKKAVNELQAAMRNLQQGSVVNVQQFKDLQAQLVNKKDAIAKAQSSIIGLGGSLKKTKFGDFRNGLKDIASEAKGIGGPLGGMFGKMEALSKLAGTGAVKYVALAGGLAALAGASIYAGKALFDLAFSSSEARREEDLQLQSQLSLTKGIGDTSEASETLLETIDQVSGRSAASRSAIVGLGKDLYAAGLRGGALEDALDAAATTAAVQGPAAAQKFVALAAATDKAGGSVAALADKVDKNIGGIAQKKLLSTAVQAEKFKENIGGLFANVNIDGLLKARKGFNDLFSGATASGKAFKAILGPIAQSLIDGVQSWTETMAKAVVRGLIWATKLEIGWLKLKLLFFRIFPRDLFDGFSGKEALIGGVAAALIALGVALAPIVVAAATAAAPFVLAAVAIWAVINTVRLLIDLFDELFDWGEIKDGLYKALIEPFKLFDVGEAALTVGKNIVMGLIHGIASMASFFVDALKALAKSGFGAFKHVLGISSPSKEFAALGSAIPAGVKQGVDAGKPQVDKSLINLVDPSLVANDVNVGNQALQASAAAGSAAGGAAGGSTTNNFTFNISGENAREISSAVEEKVRQFFTVTGQQMGAY